jgi:carbonic anhydrase
MKSHGALDRLLEGNRRFVSGERVGVHCQWQPDVMAVSQKPFAAILGCSDSRVPPEQIFDLGPGEIFVVRVAGNVAGPSELGSLEYAVKHLDVALVLVLGHEQCGAVKAALEDEGEGAIADVVDRIKPAVKPVLNQVEKPRDPWMEAVKANVWYTMSGIVEKSGVIAEAVQRGDVSLEGALFSFASGKVSTLEERG